MKTIITILFLLAAFIAPIGNTHAGEQDEKLKQLTTQLQGNPNNAALREEIIKLALTINPAPAVPEEARKSFVRGNSAFADAKSPEEFDRAIALYREALKLAPWWGDAYFNIAKALEQRQNYGEAVAHLKLYLIAMPAALDAREIQDKIYALEEKAERAAKEANAKAQADAAKAERQRWAAEIVQWLRTNYGGRLKGSIMCGVFGRAGGAAVQCTDAEAKGSNWHTVLSESSSSEDLRGDNIRFGYSTSGPDNDLIQVRLRYDTVCGVPKNNSIDFVDWSRCDKPSSTVRLRWLRSSRDNKPLISFVYSCEGDLCSREQYTLEN